MLGGESNDSRKFMLFHVCFNSWHNNRLVHFLSHSIFCRKKDLMINEIVVTFRDLKKLLMIHQSLCEIAENNLAYYKSLMKIGCPHDIGAMTYDGMPKATKVNISLDRIVDMINKYTEMLENEKSNLERVQSSIDEINQMIEHMDGIVYKVACKRIVEGKRIEVIAQELNVSVAYIKKISAGIGR